MKLFNIVCVLSLLFPLKSLAADRFLFPDEEVFIEHKSFGNLDILVLEDFLNNSLEKAQVVAIEGEILLVRRDESLALLVPQDQFSEISDDPFIAVVQGKSCQSECAGAAIGGALTGAVTGAGSGATAGAPFGPHGAGGGAVVGGFVGGVGGGMSAWHICKWATGCGSGSNANPPKKEK